MKNRKCFYIETTKHKDMSWSWRKLDNFHMQAVRRPDENYESSGQTDLQFALTDLSSQGKENLIDLKYESSL